jgi:hypothetical protein
MAYRNVAAPERLMGAVDTDSGKQGLAPGPGRWNGHSRGRMLAAALEHKRTRVMVPRSARGLVPREMIAPGHRIDNLSMLDTGLSLCPSAGRSRIRGRWIKKSGLPGQRSMPLLSDPARHNTAQREAEPVAGRRLPHRLRHVLRIAVMMLSSSVASSPCRAGIAAAEAATCNSINRSGWV